MALLKEYLKGILAGLFIGSGGSVFLACDNRYVGAVLFSVALLTICLCGYSLYTGKVGTMAFNHAPADLAGLGMCLLGNISGTFLMGLGVRLAVPALAQKVASICEAKLMQSVPEALLRAAFCGMLMYIAVTTYKRKETVFGILFCVPVFILCGFEHSVANMFYFALDKGISFKTVLYIALIVIGNSIGALIVAFLEKATVLSSQKPEAKS